MRDVRNKISGALKSRLPKTLFLTLILGAFTSMCFGGMVTGITGADGTIPIVQGTQATPSGLNIIANGGDVKIAFAGADASDFDLIYNNTSLLAINQLTTLGHVVDLGTFTAGTVITLDLYDLDNGQNFKTGPASGNPDNAIHAAYATWTANSAINFNGEFVGLEDAAKGTSGYGDFNDAMFVIEGASTGSSVPEPSTWLLMGAGLVALSSIRFRKRQQS